MGPSWDRRSSCSQMFFEMALLKISHISQENTCAGAFRPATLLKRDSDTISEAILRFVLVKLSICGIYLFPRLEVPSISKTLLRRIEELCFRWRSCQAVYTIYLNWIDKANEHITKACSEPCKTSKTELCGEIVISQKLYLLTFDRILRDAVVR